MLLFLSNEVVSLSKEVVGNKILEDPLRVNRYSIIILNKFIYFDAHY